MSASVSPANSTFTFYCSGNRVARRPDRRLVSGTLTLAGKPYTHAAVFFSSDALGIHMAVNVDSQGKFSMRTASGLVVEVKEGENDIPLEMK